MASKPTHEQAQLQLQIYEIRREPRLRQARDWFFQNYFADTIDDGMKIAPFGSEEGRYLMMVFGYWEQTCALLNYGLLHEDLFFEVNNEFFGVWERIKSHIAQARERFTDKQFLTHMENAARRYETWIETRSPGYVTTMRKFTNEMRNQHAKAA